MGAEFSKLQGVLTFAQEILLADNLEGLKTLPTTSAPKTQEKSEVELQCVH
jgi:hypothetical protein